LNQLVGVQGARLATFAVRYFVVILTANYRRFGIFRHRLRKVRVVGRNAIVAVNEAVSRLAARIIYYLRKNRKANGKEQYENSY